VYFTYTVVINCICFDNHKKLNRLTFLFSLYHVFAKLPSNQEPVKLPFTVFEWRCYCLTFQWY